MVAKDCDGTEIRVGDWAEIIKLPPRRADDGITVQPRQRFRVAQINGGGLLDPGFQLIELEGADFTDSTRTRTRIPFTRSEVRRAPDQPLAVGSTVYCEAPGIPAGYFRIQAVADYLTPDLGDRGYRYTLEGVSNPRVHDFWFKKRPALQPLQEVPKVSDKVSEANDQVQRQLERVQLELASTTSLLRQRDEQLGDLREFARTLKDQYETTDSDRVYERMARSDLSKQVGQLTERLVILQQRIASGIRRREDAERQLTEKCVVIGRLNDRLGVAQGERDLYAHLCGQLEASVRELQDEVRRHRGPIYHVGQAVNRTAAATGRAATATGRGLAAAARWAGRQPVRVARATGRAVAGSWRRTDLTGTLLASAFIALAPVVGSMVYMGAFQWQYEKQAAELSVPVAANPTDPRERAWIEARARRLGDAQLQALLDQSVK